MEEAWVPGALDAFLRPLRKVRIAALPGLRLGPSWCSRPVSLSHCLIGESESEGRDPLGEKARVAAVTRDSLWVKCIGVNTTCKATNPHRGEASLLRCGMGVTTSIVGKRIGWKPD